MGCNSCKEKKGVASSSTPDYVEKVDISQSSIGERVLMFFVKTILFAFSLIIGLPIIIPFTIYMLFKVIYLNQGVDVTTGLVNVGKMLKNRGKHEDDDEGDASDYEEDELVMMDVDDITEENRS